MDSLNAFAATKLAALDAASLRRRLAPTVRDGVTVWRDGRRLVSFCCNDYLGLATHPRVKDAARRAIETYGTGAGASRLVTGDHPLLEELETRLARFKQAEAACVFGSGYLANLGILPTLAGRDDLILMDELAHSCLRAGAKLSSAQTLVFPHNDVAALEGLLRAHRASRRHCLIVTDGVFSMDGDLAPLGALARAARAQDAWLLADDAHGLGVLNGGRGSTADHDAPLQMGTLSKALGSYGGYVCATRAVVDLIKTRAASFIYTTGLPPASAAAAIAALDIVESEPARVARPLALARLFCETMKLPQPQSSIVPLVVGEAPRALALSKALEDEGFLVTAIRPPTVPPGTARLRVTFSAAHEEMQVAALARALADRWARA